ncbi:MAG: UDP-N-acetylmuramate dehydrogenase [Treponema sp.]|nr:UDP-N-acetylmuramate dehydrogenase [Treponema sp.]MCL2271352.1 UDP-N-acetylmuramate dehydrogenase [Treponema sp.]
MFKNEIAQIIENCLREFSCEADVRYDEPMSGHSAFKTGGKADCWLQPKGENFPYFCASLLKNVQQKKIPFFILGGGANILVSDRGIRGIVLDTGEWKGENFSMREKEKKTLVFKSGTTMDAAAMTAAARNLSGIEFLAGMPGTIGGAVFMNARCYGYEISDVLAWTEIIDFKDFEIKKITTNQDDFEYKHSPFQKMDCLILNACFNLKRGDKNEIIGNMNENIQDRTNKGHYLFPCAGSIFKNNRDFGKPAGKIIDELGLKGYKKGGAQIAPFHGNIIINTGGASAFDIRSLMDEIAEKVKNAAGFQMENEIIFAGEWEKY